jgi:hypothetical protein
MTTSTTRSAEAPPAVAARRLPSGWAVAMGAVLLALLFAYARWRWPGLVPIGSDNDEYRMVGQALARFEAPVVAGVEGTKYPLGYPAVLALLEWLRLPVAAAAQALNVIALIGAVAGLAWLAGRPREDRPVSPGAAFAAGGLVVTSAAVWNDVYSIMPELLLLIVLTALLVTVDRPLHDQRYGRLTALAVAAVLLKTMAALAVGGMVLGLLFACWRGDRDGTVRRAAWWRPLLPGAGGALAVLGGMLLMRPYPSHTTGYVAMFPLADPDDASRGRLGIGGLVRRTIEDVPSTIADLGRAITLVDGPRGLAIAVAIVGLTLGVVGAWRLGRRSPLGPVALGMVLAYTVGMTTWPYHAPRFGLPLVPVAALGVGWLARAVGSDTAVSATTMATPATAPPTRLRPTAGETGEALGTRLERQHGSLAVVRGWVRANAVPDGSLVSMDYRELARELEQTVQPIGYTSDPDALWTQVEGAEHLVVLDLYRKRTRQVEVLLETHRDRFEPVLDEAGVRVFAVRD